MALSLPIEASQRSSGYAGNASTVASARPYDYDLTASIFGQPQDKQALGSLAESLSLIKNRQIDRAQQRLETISSQALLPYVEKIKAMLVDYQKGKLKPSYVFSLSEGLSAVLDEKKEAAAKHFEAALIEDDRHIYAYYFAALLYTETDNLTAAKNYAKKCIDLEARDLSGYFALACAYYKGREYSRAEKILKDALRVDYSNSEILINLAVVYLRMNKLQLALHSLEDALDITPQQARGYLVLGSVYQALKESEKSLSAYDRAIEIDPRSVQARINMAGVLYSLQRYEQALNMLKKAGQLSLGNILVEYNSGLVCQALDNYRLAVQEFKKVLNKTPYDAQAHFGLAKAYAGQGLDEDAAAAYMNALSHNPAMISAYEGLGRIYLKQEKCSPAKKYLSIAEELYQRAGNLNEAGRLRKLIDPCR